MNAGHDSQLLALTRLYLLVNLLLIAPALAQNADQNSESPGGITARGANYEVVRSGPDDHLNCLYRDKVKLLCPEGVEFVSIEQHHKLRDYDLIIVSMGQLGSGTRWHDWSVIAEDGKRGTIKELASACLECEIKVKRLGPSSNEALFIYRQEQHLVTARFHEGRLTMRKSKLDPHEPLGKEDCGGLFGIMKQCKETKPNSFYCTTMGSTARNFFIRRIVDHHSGFSIGRLEQQCRAACSTGKLMDRKSFFKRVCRHTPD
ncbi:hypothetical protein ACFQZO_35515 [Bradyrhizobium sp. GCM10027634]|uniref:hypothetical protein n=1 Tax=unclassified Bradyrhizobium TaxID=2631580 RepID=UPI00188BF763|nr:MULTISPECIES: hypothetical protein [unclassified Bradyrhizobium]MDN5006160.1 hypothetical protein [Bradyrhizobium sp. WYCCWR 12677]QOZ45105.1 hypothetical protein XH89_17695 [Bradyrhizobium sp. CCBAU 53340]